MLTIGGGTLLFFLRARQILNSPTTHTLSLSLYPLSVSLFCSTAILTLPITHTLFLSFAQVVLAEHVESPLFFGFVARNPGVENKYCHVFGMEKKNHAQQVHGLVTKAFRLAFAKDRTIKLKSSAFPLLCWPSKARSAQTWSLNSTIAIFPFFFLFSAEAQKEPVQGVPATPPLHAQTSARPAAPVARPSNETPICPRSPVPGHTPASQLHQKPPLKQQQRQQRQQEEHQQQQQEQQQAQLLLPQAVAQRSAEINRTNGRAWAKHNPLEGMSRPPRLIASKPIQGISERVTSSQGGGTHHLPHHAVAEPKLVLLPAVPSQTSKAVGKQLPPKQSWPEQAQLAANVPTAVQPRGNLTPTTPTAPPIEDPDYGDALDSEFDDMSTAAWYQAGIPREIAMELLSLSEDGAFMVRDSQTQPGNFALTMKAQDMMHHFIIRLVPGGFVLGSSEMAQMPFPTLSVLIQHYAVEAGCLPRPLSMLSFNRLYSEDPPTTPTMHAAFDDKPSSFVDPNYQSLKDVLAAAV